jgi:hypothetical protein
MAKIVIAISPLANSIDGLDECTPHFGSIEFVPFLQSGDWMADDTSFLVSSGEAANVSLPKPRKQTPN